MKQIKIGTCVPGAKAEEWLKGFIGKGFETFSYCCPKHPFFFSDFSAVSSVICEQIRKLSKTESFLICCIVSSTLLLSSRGQSSAASESWTEQQKAHPHPFVQTAPSMSGLHRVPRRFLPIFRICEHFPPPCESSEERLHGVDCRNHPAAHSDDQSPGYTASGHSFRC